MTKSTPQHERHCAVVREYYARLGRLDIEGAVALYAEDVAGEMPYAPPGVPTHLPDRAAILAYARRFPGLYRRLEIRRLTVSPMLDPERVVAEWEAEIETAGGQRLHNTLVVLFRLRDGRIVHIKEFFNPQAHSSTATGAATP